MGEVVTACQGKGDNGFKWEVIKDNVDELGREGLVCISSVFDVICGPCERWHRKCTSTSPAMWFGSDSGRAAFVGRAEGEEKNSSGLHWKMQCGV